MAGRGRGGLRPAKIDFVCFFTWHLAIKKVAMAKKFQKIENHIGKPPKIIEKTPKITPKIEQK